MVPKLYIRRTADGSDFPLPTYESKHHMALNLSAAVSSPVKLNPGERLYVPVGFAIGIPDGFCGQIVSLPALAKNHGIIVLDAPSLVHPANRTPLFVLLENASPYQYILRRQTVIAQLLIMPAVQVCWEDKTQNDILSDQKTTTAQMMLDQNQEQTSALVTPSRRPVRSIRDGFKEKKDEN